MRLSTDYYPEYVDFYCRDCGTDHIDARVESIEGDDVYVTCEFCGEPTYVRVIE